MKNIFGNKLTSVITVTAVTASFAVMPMLTASADDIEIKTAQELVSIAEAVNSGDSYAGKTVRLANDIDLSGIEWTPIGSQDSDGYVINAFEGTFDGGSHSITGLHINNENGREQGLFGIVSGTVKNLKVEGEITAGSTAGGIAGWSYGKIINCVSDVDITARREAGGIVGTLSRNGYIEACVNEGNITVTNKETYAGGIAAQNTRGFVLNSSNSGRIENGSADTSDAFRNKIGGIVGYLNSGKIENSDNSGDVVSYETVASYTADTTHNYVGGIVGYSEGGTITYSDNSGMVHNAVNYAGGIAGYLQSRDSVMYCNNSGAVSSGVYAGGIVGYNRSDVAVCENTGTVVCADGFAGGVAAYLSSGTLNNCTFTNNDGLQLVGGNDIGRIIDSEEEKPTAPPVSATTPPDSGSQGGGSTTVPATSTPEASPEPTATAEPEETSSPEPTATAEPEETASPEPTATAAPEETASPSPTATTAPEETSAPTPTATASPEPEETAEPTPTAPAEPTSTPGADATPEPAKTSVYEEDGIIIIATYNEDNSLVSVKISGEVKANDEVTEIEIEPNQKVFVWTSLQDMKPVSVIEIDAGESENG